MIYPDDPQTSEAVAGHYNDLDQYYRKLWGEHLHHGLWKYGNETVEQATQGLIDLVIEQGKIDDTCKVLDVGCGYGATSQYLARKVGAMVTALTISKSQWQYARTHDPESANPRYILGDFLHNEFKPASYDAIISIESSEHMVDKEKFFAEVVRLLKPGGRFVTCAWLSKENPSQWEIKHLLAPICSEGRLPSMGTANEYKEMMERAGLTDITFQDLTKQVKKTWSICIWRGLKAFFHNKELRNYVLDKNSNERVFAKSLFRILAAYNTGAMRYGIFKGVKQ